RATDAAVEALELLEAADAERHLVDDPVGEAFRPARGEHDLVMVARVAAQEGEFGLAEPSRVGDRQAEDVALEGHQPSHVGDEEPDMAEAKGEARAHRLTSE